MSLAATYVNQDTFTVATDLTSTLMTGRRVRANCGNDGYKYGTILSSSYSNPNTTVNLTTSSDNLTPNLTAVEYGIIGKDSNQSLPEHVHDGSEGSGGELTGVGPHAIEHVTGGSDVVANVVPSGNAGLMTGDDKDKLDNVENNATADQTGGEIVTLLEALVGGTKLSHDNGLSDISTDDHHAQLHATSHNSGGGDELNHDSLAGFVLNEHINHTNVTITTTEGIQGGGDISANRTFKTDVNGLAADGSPDGTTDYVMTYDASAALHKKVLLDNLPGGGGVTDHGDLTGLEDDDHSQYHNDTRGDARYFQKTEFLNVSTGAGDAGKPIILDATGHVDVSMVNDADIALANLGEKAHGSLTEVLPDQHHARYTDAEAVASVETAGLYLGYDAHIYATDSLIRAAYTHMFAAPLSSDQLGDGSIFQGRHGGVDKFWIDKDGNITLVGKVDGVDVSGFKYLSVGPPAFVPYSDEYDWVIGHDGLYNRVSLLSQTFGAPVFLPHGATISRLTLFGHRTSALADLILQLYRDDNVGGSVLMAEVVADWITGASSGYDDTISYATIDNTAYSYNLVLMMDPKAAKSSMDVGFYRAQINLA